MRDGFIFDGKTSHDFNLVPCYINGNGDIETNISRIEFQNFKPANSDKEYFTGSTYPESLTTTLSVCQMVNCEFVNFTYEDIESIQRWLCREDGYYPFGFIDDDKEMILYDAKFDIVAKKYGNDVVALEFTVTTNAPYGYTPKKITRTLAAQEELVVIDYSSKVGHIQPNITLKCLSAGDYTIVSEFDNVEPRLTSIQNCKQNEVITINDMCVISSSEDRDLSDDFNYVYPLIYNNLKTNKNTFWVNKPCELTIQYNQKRKVGLM